MQATASTTSPARDAEQIETHNEHSVSDYIREGMLKPECVNVRLVRESAGVYAVEISILDREYTFEDEVAREVAAAVGGRVLTSGCGNGITVMARDGFRAKHDFVKVEAL